MLVVALPGLKMEWLMKYQYMVINLPQMILASWIILKKNNLQTDQKIVNWISFISVFLVIQDRMLFQKMVQFMPAPRRGYCNQDLHTLTNLSHPCNEVGEDLVLTSEIDLIKYLSVVKE